MFSAVAMVTALPNGMSQDNQSQGHPRPGFPRTQYNMQYSSTPRVNAGDMPQPSSSKYKKSVIWL